MNYRKTVILVLSLFVAVCMHAQDITLKADKTPIRDVIETLQRDYGYSFSIRTSEVNVDKTVSLDVKSTDIETVLDKIFAGTNVSYSIDGNLISITKAAAPRVSAPQKNARVRGVVVDDAGVPVAGASVMLKGTKTGAITDIDGNFDLDCGKPAPVTLEVAFLGMANRTLLSPIQHFL